MIVHVGLHNDDLVDINTGDVLVPFIMDMAYVMYAFTEDAAIRFSEITGRNKYTFFKNTRYIIGNDESLLIAAVNLDMYGYITFNALEKELFSEYSDKIINIYSSEYATDDVLSQFTKEYGSDIVIRNSTIKHSRLRNDKREFGLKYAKPGIYHDLIYFDWHNFYPNIMLEIGCPRNMDRDKIKMLLSIPGTKSFLNKLIGRFDAEYSLFYDPEYANLLRRFGRMKLIYWAFKCEELIFCNTDSILAKVSKDFEVPDNTSVMVVDHALVKNIGNYVLYNSDNIKHTGIFNKPEELVIAKHRMGIQIDYKEFLISSIFNTDEPGYLSADNNMITSIDRKCRYGKSDKLFINSLVSIQENI